MNQFPAETVGVVVDSYHVWWDPELAAQVERAATVRQRFARLPV